MSYKNLLYFLTFFLCAMATETSSKNCSLQDCATNPDCKCYCSHKCDYREKDKGDMPFVKDGICFCKPWDYQNYYRCKK